MKVESPALDKQEQHTEALTVNTILHGDGKGGGCKSEAVKGHGEKKKNWGREKETSSLMACGVGT